MKTMMMMVALLPLVGCVGDEGDDSVGGVDEAVSNSNPAAVKICRADLGTGYSTFTVQGIGQSPVTQIDLIADHTAWGGGLAVNPDVVSVAADCAGNISMSVTTSLFWLAGVSVYDHGMNMKTLLPTPANGACIYTNGTSATSWPYPVSCGGGSTGGAGGSTGGGTGHPRVILLQ